MKWYEEGSFITRSHIERMKENAFIVDLSTEGIEGSVPHSIYSPVFRNGHIVMYSNGHIPTLSASFASEQISKALAPYVDKVIEERFDPALDAAMVVFAGRTTATTGKLAYMTLKQAGLEPDPQPAALRKFEKSPGFFGVKASSRIAKGDFILSFIGPIVTEKSRYSLQIGASRHVDSCGGIRIIDDFINHSCSPNAFVVFPVLDVRALRDIECGEEVLINYCATEEELFESFNCYCGSPQCYGQVRGFRFLNRSQQMALKDIASPWLNAKYEL
jgi:hypothetical protein